MNSIRFSKSSQDLYVGGIPVRGKARKIGVRVDASPVVSPRQNGEFADSASSTGMCTRIPLTTWIALSGSSSPTCTCTPKISSWRATNASAEIRSRYRGRAAIRWSSHSAHGCERLGVEDHQLLLDSNRELMPLEVVLHCEEANDDRASLGGRAWVPSTAAPETAKEFTHGKRYRVEGRSHLRAAWRPSGRPVGPSVPHDRRLVAAPSGAGLHRTGDARHRPQHRNDSK